MKILDIAAFAAFGIAGCLLDSDVWAQALMVDIVTFAWLTGAAWRGRLG